MIRPVHAAPPTADVSVSEMVVVAAEQHAATSKRHMILVMDLLYLISIVCALTHSIRTGAAQVYPCFAVSLAYLAMLQLFYQPFSPEWLSAWYPTLAAGYALMRILATAEAFLAHSQGHARRSLLAASAIMLAIVCSAIMVWQITGPSMLMSAIQARRVVNVGLFAFLGIYALLRWSMGEWAWTISARHLILSLAMSAALVAPSLLMLAAPRDWWWILDPLFYCIKSALLITWAVVAIPRPPAVHVSAQFPARCGPADA